MLSIRENKNRFLTTFVGMDPGLNKVKEARDQSRV